MDFSIIVNQVGYLPNAVKYVVVQSKEPLGTVNGNFQVLEGPETVYSGILTYRGSIWGWHYWVGDFSALSQEGTYRILGTVGSLSNTSYPFSIRKDAYNNALHLASRFFYYQRCGCKVEGWHEPCHLDDAYILSENMHIDAVGGWHGSGGYDKTGSQLFAVYALAQLYEDSRHLLKEALSEALWGAQWLMKMQTPLGGLYKNLNFAINKGYIDPAKDTDNVVGTEDDRLIQAFVSVYYGATLLCTIWNGPECKLAAASLAKLAQVVEDQSLSKSFQEKAERFWAYAADDDELYTNSAHLLADTELYKLTSDKKYLTDGEIRAENVLNGLNDYGAPKVPMDWYEIMYVGLPSASLTLWHKTLSKPSLPPKLKAYYNLLEELCNNPFGILRLYIKIGGSYGSFWFMPKDLPRYVRREQAKRAFFQYVGLNTYYLSNAWSMLLYSSLTGEEKFRNTAQRILDWVLGANPLNLCMLEDAGSNNPPRYFNLMSAIKGHEDGRVPGAVPNGITRPPQSDEDIPYFDLSDKPRYTSTEPWCPNNYWLILTINELIKLYSLRC